MVLVETEEIKEKSASKLYQWLKKNVPQQEFLPLSPSKLKQWIEKEFQRYHLKASPRAQEALARASGNDLWRLSGEIRKIASWKKYSPRLVKEADITLFVNPNVQTDVFLTIDAIARRNKKQALGLLYRHLEKGDSPHYLFSMLTYQFRTILQILDMAEKKLSYEAMLQKTKLHPFALKKGLQVAQNFSLLELKATYEKLFVLDKNLKTGKEEAEGVFDLFVARIS